MGQTERGPPADLQERLHPGTQAPGGPQEHLVWCGANGQELLCGGRPGEERNPTAGPRSCVVACAAKARSPADVVDSKALTQCYLHVRVRLV